MNFSVIHLLWRMRTEMSVDRVELVAVLCSVLSDPQTIVKNETFRKL